MNLLQCNPTNLPHALWSGSVFLNNLGAKADTVMLLEGASLKIPFSGSKAQGLVFGEETEWGWNAWQLAGIRLSPDGFSLLQNSTGSLVATANIRVEESAARLKIRAEMPINDPQKTRISCELPEVELNEQDAIFTPLRKQLVDVTLLTQVAARTDIQFLGTQPQAAGFLHLRDGRMTRKEVTVEGVTLDVPFEAGVTFRTIKRPQFSFKHCKVGNILLDQGRVFFQITPEEFFIDRMEVGWCKGSLNAYSVHLDRREMKDEFVVYADRIDLGEALMMVMPFLGATSTATSSSGGKSSNMPRP